MKLPFTAMLASLLSILILPLAAAQDYKDQIRDYPPDLRENSRPAIPEDYYPGGVPALLPQPSISIWDVVVSNTDPNLKNNNHTANSEPSIAINPSHPNEVIILSFTGGWGVTAPIWYSTNGGGLWALEYTITNPPGLSEDGCPCDQTPDFGPSGNLSATFLHTDSLGIDAYTSTTSDPIVLPDWQWFTVGGVTQTTDQVGKGGADQPWLLVNRDPKKKSQTNVYVAYDNFDGAPDMRVAVASDDPPDFTVDSLVGFSGGAVNPGQRLAKDLTTHAIYSLWQVCPIKFQNCNNIAADPKTIDFHLNRSTDGGKTWGLNGNPAGIFLVETQSTQPQPKFGTVNALLGGVDHIAVDPNNSDVYVVYGNRDSNTGNNRLSIARLTADGHGGLKWVSSAFVSPQADAALPSVAIAKNSHGTIGVLYTRFDGIDSKTKLPKFSAWLAISNDHGKTFAHNMLESFLATTVDDHDPRQRILGDYQQLKAVGKTFYGVFSGNGVPFGRPFANIDPIFFKTTVTD